MENIKYLYKDAFAVIGKAGNGSADEGILYCHSCAMPMTKAEDFGTGAAGNPIRDYCHYCYKNGALREMVTMDGLIAGIRKLVDIEAAYPDLLSTPLLKYIKMWLALDETAKTTSVPTLLSALIDGQDCDFTGTQWEKEWLADGKVCHCKACTAARKCISDIKLMEDSVENGETIMTNKVTIPPAL
jgi:hypothetical protein